MQVTFAKKGHILVIGMDSSILGQIPDPFNKHQSDEEKAAMWDKLRADYPNIKLLSQGIITSPKDRT